MICFVSTMTVNPRAPVAQKLAYEVVFRRFQSEGVEFFEVIKNDIYSH